MSFIKRSQDWLSTKPSMEALLKTYRGLQICTRPGVTEEELETVRELVSDAALQAGATVEDLLAIEQRAQVHSTTMTGDMPSAVAEYTFDTSPLSATECAAPVVMLTEAEKRSTFESLKQQFGFTSAVMRSASYAESC